MTEENVNHEIQAKSMKQRITLGGIYNTKIPLKVKGNFTAQLRLAAVLYGHENKLSVVELTMING